MTKYHIYKLFVLDFHLKEIDNPLVIEILIRIFYILKCLMQLFTLSSACWTVCIAISLLVSFLLENEDHDAKLITLFYFISVFIPLISVTIWGVLFQINITSRTQVNLFPDNQMLLASYYFFNSGFLTLCLLINIFLLIWIWLSIRNTIKVFYYQKESISQSKIIFNLSLYIIPFLVCGSWQITGFFIYGLKQLYPNNDNIGMIYHIIAYPYSFFFPLQGFLNCLLFYIKSEKTKRFFSKLCCRSNHMDTINEDD